MKRVAAFTLAVVLFAVPTVALAIDHPKLSEIFNQYEKTLWRDDA